ncbi:MAG: DMT family transporter [Firmicutes bacterium]|nr:DMT family transporter [Bacillota bacterium]MCL5039523.1 DMT family transporter [Bacillota bacterium]
MRPQMADFLLLVVALIWGSTFVIVKEAIVFLPPFIFLAWRFALAFLTLLPLTWRHLKGDFRQALPAGIILGLFLFAGYAFQTLGLQFTTPARAGFITGLSVVLVPLLGAHFLGEKPGLYPSLGAFLAFVGLALLSLGGGYFSFSLGDLLVLLCAVSFALHILWVGRFSARFDPYLLTTLQIGLVALLAAALTPLELHHSPLAGQLPSPQSVGVEGIWLKIGGALLLTGTLATSLAFLLQNSLQRFTTPTHTALIFATEPVFAALSSYLLSGEVLPAQGLLGGGLVVMGMLLAEVGNRKATRLSSRGNPVTEKPRSSRGQSLP